MAAKVFLCYRRDDSAHFAGRVQDRLEHEFGRDLLFMDVDAIPLGVNFSRVLREEVAKCGVLLAVIGPNWLDARDKDGNRRLDDPNDFVRIEIAAALQRDIRVIPILLDGARVPKADQLPKDLEELALRNSLDVRHASFHNDVDRLVRSLKGQLAGEEQQRLQSLATGAGGVPSYDTTPSLRSAQEMTLSQAAAKFARTHRFPLIIAAGVGLAVSVFISVGNFRTNVNSEAPPGSASPNEKFGPWSPSMSEKFTPLSSTDKFAALPPSPPFEIRTNTELRGLSLPTQKVEVVSSTGECEEKCTRLAECKFFTFKKSTRSCTLFSHVAVFRSDEGFDSGIRK